jgi:O-acetylhomoserine (thiol)-lyase
MKPETIAIHGGYVTEATTKAVAVPIYQTVAYEFDRRPARSRSVQPGGAGQHLHAHHESHHRCAGKARRRVGGGIAGLAVSAGSAAINYAILTIAEAGSNIVTVPLLYGGTYTLFAHMFPKLGIEVRFARDDSPPAWKS